MGREMEMRKNPTGELAKSRIIGLHIFKSQEESTQGVRFLCENE